MGNGQRSVVNCQWGERRLIDNQQSAIISNKIPSHFPTGRRLSGYTSGDDRRPPPHADDGAGEPVNDGRRYAAGGDGNKLPRFHSSGYFKRSCRVTTAHRPASRRDGRDLRMLLGRRANVLTERRCRVPGRSLKSPVLLPEQMAALRTGHPEFAVATVAAVWRRRREKSRRRLPAMRCAQR